MAILVQREQGGEWFEYAHTGEVAAENWEDGINCAVRVDPTEAQPPEYVTAEVEALMAVIEISARIDARHERLESTWSSK